MKIRNITMALALSLTVAATAEQEGQAKTDGADRSSKAQSAEELFVRYDTNKDGQVTFEEYRGGKFLFTAYDLDGNGVLTPEELKAAKATNNRPSFKTLDTDKDGFVTRREWQGTQQEFDAVDADGDGVWSRADLAIEKSRTRAKSTLDRFDKDKDGLLTTEEWTATGHDEASFRKRDLNRNGTLDVEELAMSMRTPKQQ